MARAKKAESARPIDHRYRRRDHFWRVQSNERGDFDECVVITGRQTATGVRESGLILHAEMMDGRSMFVDICGLCLWTWVDRKGIAQITMIEDRRKRELPPITRAT